MQEWSGIEAGFQGFSVCIMMYDWNLFVLYFTVSECKDNLLVNPPPKKNETTKKPLGIPENYITHPEFSHTRTSAIPRGNAKLWKESHWDWSEAKAHPQGSHESYENKQPNKMHWFFEGKMCDGHQNPSKTWPTNMLSPLILPLQNLSHTKITR